MSTAKLPEPAPAPEQADHGDRRVVTLLARGILDEVWVAAFEQSTDDLMRKFSVCGSGSDYQLIRKTLVSDLDPQALLNTIGREFMVRLAREIERGAGINLDLRYLRMEVSEAGAMRFVTCTVRPKDAAAIYDWNVTRAAPRMEKPAIGVLNRWDWGLWLDSIVRTIDNAETRGTTVYADLHRKMWNDGFIAKAVVLALKHPSLFRQGLGFRDCTIH
jgi:hypothetical protein